MERTLKEEFDPKFDAMDKRLTEMEDKIDSIDTKLTQVVEAILGNPLTKTGGFITQITDLNKEIVELNQEIENLKIKQYNEIEELKKKQAEHDRFKDRVIWTVGIGISLAALIKLGVSIYTASSI